MPIGGGTDRKICHIHTKMLLNIVLSTFILSLAVHCRYAEAHWGMWSAWNTCSGDCTTAVQTRTRLCSGDSCPGSNQQTKKCVPFVQNEDCARCKLNTANIGYLANCNDSTKFYQCQKDINGHYTLSLMSCADCTMWDQTKLTCVRDPSRNDCNNNMGSTGAKEHVTTFGSTCQRGDLHFGVISGDSTKYMMYSYGVAIEMRCPMGTRFSITECGCTYVDTTHMVQTQLKPEMCITFETMTETSKWGFSESSVWISNHGKNWDSEHVQTSFNDCIEGRKCAYFNGQSYLSVDTLANSFHTWKKFTISLWYKPGHLGTMGLLTNGLTSNGCSSLPTVSITTTNGQLNSHVALKDRAAQLKGQVVPNEWNHVSLIKDDDSISMYVNGKIADQREIEGDLLPSQCSMMFGIGKNQAFFQGEMDKICLYKGALTEQQAIEEYVKWIRSDGYTGARFQHSGTGASIKIGATGAKYFRR